jgi:hypothetical protein
MDSKVTGQPHAVWVEVPTADGGTRLEMRWTTDAPAVATHAA